MKQAWRGYGFPAPRPNEMPKPLCCAADWLADDGDGRKVWEPTSAQFLAHLSLKRILPLPFEEAGRNERRAANPDLACVEF